MNNSSNSSLFETFLKENYQLFAIMAIFGALTIYLNSLILESTPEEAKIMLQFGMVICIFLFLLVSLLIFWSAYDKRYIQDAFISIESTLIFLFLILLFGLVYSITFFVFISFPLYFNSLIGVVLSIIGITCLFEIDKRLRNINIILKVLILIFLFCISYFGQQYSIKNEVIPGYLFFNAIMAFSFFVIIIIVIRSLFRR